MMTDILLMTIEMDTLIVLPKIIGMTDTRMKCMTTGTIPQETITIMMKITGEIIMTTKMTDTILIITMTNPTILTDTLPILATIEDSDAMTTRQGANYSIFDVKKDLKEEFS